MEYDLNKFNLWRLKKHNTSYKRANIFTNLYWLHCSQWPFVNLGIGTLTLELELEMELELELILQMPLFPVP